MVDDLFQLTQDSARGGFFLFSGAVLSSIILAVSAILMGRFLGPELYGQYNLVLVIPSLLLLFTDLGINAGITKFAASLRAQGKSERIKAIIHHGLIFRLAIGILVSTLSIALANYLALLINRPDFSFFIQLASLSVVFQVIFTTSNSAFVGLDKSEYSALNATIRAVLTTILQIALICFSFSLTGALVGFVGGFIVASIFGSALLFLKFLKPNKPKTIKNESGTNRNILTLLTRYGLPVYISVVLVGFFPLYQQVILAFFSSDAAIGNFRAAFNFVTLLTVISTAITTSLLPAFSKLESEKPEVISAFFNKANKYTCLLIVPITVFIIAFSEPIVTLLYGSSYTSAPLFLSLSCSVFLFSIIGSLTLSSVFNGLGKTRLTMNVTIINFVLLLFLTPLLGLFYSVIGVIVASLIASAVAYVYGAIIANNNLKITFNFNSNLRICSISLLSVFPPLSLILFTTINSVLLLLVGGLFYLMSFITLMPLTKIVGDTELNALSRLTARLPLVKSFAKFLFRYQHKILQYAYGSKQGY